MWRKITILSIASVYLLLQVGLNLHAHFCGDEETASWFLIAPDNKCGCQEEGMDSDCCHEQVTVYQLTDHQVHAQQISPKPSPFFLLPTYLPSATGMATVYHYAQAFTQLEWPPPLQALAIFIRIQNFRI